MLVDLVRKHNHPANRCRIAGSELAFYHRCTASSADQTNFLHEMFLPGKVPVLLASIAVATASYHGADQINYSRSHQKLQSQAHGSARLVPEAVKTRCHRCDDGRLRQEGVPPAIRRRRPLQSSFLNREQVVSDEGVGNQKGLRDPARLVPIWRSSG